MKRFIVLLVSLTLFCMIGLIGFTGCGDNQGKVVIRGSTSVEPLMNALIDKYIEIGKYDIEFDIDVQGSSAGVLAAKQDTSGAVFGISSSAIKETDLPYLSNAFVVALDAVALIVNKDNPTTELSLDQVYKIFSGKIKQFEGISNEILVINREAGSGTRDAFDSLVKYSGEGEEKGFSLSKDTSGKNRKQEDVFPASAEFLSSTSAVLSKVVSTSSAISYISLSSLSSSVKAVSINNVAATPENVLDNSYVLQRPFSVFSGRAELTEAAKDFLRFLQSTEAQQIVLSMNFVQQLDGANDYTA